MTDKLTFTPAEAAAKTGISRDVIMRQIHAGLLRAKKVSTPDGRPGRLYLVTDKALREWVDGLEDA
jgi:excisionase family DNA binding protein